MSGTWCLKQQPSTGTEHQDVTWEQEPPPQDLRQAGRGEAKASPPHRSWLVCSKDWHVLERSGSDSQGSEDSTPWQAAPGQAPEGTTLPHSWLLPRVGGPHRYLTAP